MIKVQYSKHVYGDKVVIKPSEGRQITLKADDIVELSEDDAKGLTSLEAFTVVKEDKEPKKSAKADKEEVEVVTKNSSEEDKGE